jgi:hypothetical protein
MPTRTKVVNFVIGVVADFAGLSPGAVKESHILRRTPLFFDDNNLVYLAMSLRGYIKQHKSSATVYAKEAKKTGLTVGQLAQLVWERVR